MKVLSAHLSIPKLSVSTPEPGIFSISGHLPLEGTLSSSKKFWLENSVAQLGQSDAPIKTPLQPPHAVLTPLPQKKPELLGNGSRQTPTPSESLGAVVLTHPSTGAEEITHALWFRPHNRKAPVEAIRTDAETTHSLSGGFNSIAKELIANNVPATQFIEIMEGHPKLTPEYIKEKFAQLGYPSPDTWRESLDGSAVIHTRRELDRRGLGRLDGSGVKVWVYEANDSAHNSMVTNMIDDPQFGLAPGAITEIKHQIKGEKTPQDLEEIEQLERHVATVLTDLTQKLDRGAAGNELADQFVDGLTPVFAARYRALFEKITKVIQDFTASNAQVLNVSMDGKISALELQIHQELANGVTKQFPGLAVAITKHLSTTKMAPSTDDPWSGNRRINQLVSLAAAKGQYVNPGHKAYVESTQAAAQAGKIIVTASGNAQHIAGQHAALTGIILPDSFTLNPYGMSPHVVMVGASTTNGTPSDVSDDKMAKFSSHGNEDYGVTIATQGYNVAVPYPLLLEAGGRNSGTSFAAPTVAALAALYKQAHPHAGFEEFKDLLIRHSVLNADEPAAAQGAGMLDLLKAAQEIGTWLPAHR